MNFISCIVALFQKVVNTNASLSDGSFALGENLKDGRFANPMITIIWDSFLIHILSIAKNNNSMRLIKLKCLVLFLQVIDLRGFVHPKRIRYGKFCTSRWLHNSGPKGKPYCNSRAKMFH